PARRPAQSCPPPRARQLSALALGWRSRSVYRTVPARGSASVQTTRGVLMESATITAGQPPVDDTSLPGHKGLKRDAIGYISNLVIAVASTAPAYSLAATLGFIVAVAGVGTHAPAVLIVAFIPILFVSIGYRFFNLAD